MASSDALTLDSARISELPESGFYVPNFILPEEEQYILQEISKLPSTRWTVLSHRRLLSLPSQLTGTARDTLIAAPMPTFLSTVVLDRLKQLSLFKGSPHGAPNHCLVNEYQPGQGIMPHEDGPAYYPVTATVSLAAHTTLDIYKKNDQGEREAIPTWRILQEPRSLLITTSDMYKSTLHGIPEAVEDTDLGPETIVNWDKLADKTPFEGGVAKRQTRISLTYRDVLKVAKVGGAMKFINKR
ncbi:hypothetical protein LTR70_000476 [Exophiala xenobiotica]|uniref:Fe2OG dioxygenase domain-containing protein n=1 Tax=Lithohypha guttulata TaxID=1690604 RepID=A0ABR0K0I9_9EURO|nr:hypothetical protein LTR24_008393 [Lithohypha guttulata]KAK5330646.1 hypothetical protein LTR70_000476 [Exophiala xenobiotica]